MTQAATTALVTRLYSGFLGRSPDSAGLAGWSDQIEAGTTTAENVVKNFFDSSEFQTTVGPVARLYVAAFDRAPDSGGLASWVGNFRASNKTNINAIADGFVGSAEFASSPRWANTTSNSAFVDKLYDNILGRPSSGDAAGKTYWVNVLNSGVSRGTVLEGFAESTENKTKAAPIINVALMYQGLLSQQATAAQLTAGAALSIVDLAGSLLDQSTLAPIYVLTASASTVQEGNAITYTVTPTHKMASSVTLTYSLTGDTAPAASSADFSATTGTITIPANSEAPVTFTVTPLNDNTAESTENAKVALMNGSTELATKVFAITDAAVVPGSTFSLTTTADNFPGTTGNDTVSGLATFSDSGAPVLSGTYSVADQITGGTGTDTLSLTVDGGGATYTTGALPIASITGIETINIRAVQAEAADIVTLNAGAIPGLTGVNSDRSSSVVTVTGLAAGATFGVIGNSAVTNGASNFAYTAPGSANIAISGGTVGTSNITNTGVSSATNTITSTGATNSVGVVDLGTGSNVTTLNIAATTGLTAALAANDFAASSSIVITGAATNGVAADGSSLAAVGISNAGLTSDLSSTITTVNASGLTAGGASVFLGTGITSFIGGQGNDTVKTNGIVGDVASQINAGAGTADRLVVRNSGAGAVADVDTVQEALAYAGFEILDTGDTTAGININRFTNSSIGSVWVGGNAQLNGLTAAQAANVAVYANSTGSYFISGASNLGQLDALTLHIDDGLTAKNTLTLGNINAAGVETININATDNATVTTLTGSAALTTLNVSGAGDVSITTGAIPFVSNTGKIDASTSTGAVTIIATDVTTNGITIKGTTSTKTNTLTGSAQADDIAGGAGNDIISGLAGNDAINGGAGNDTITGGAGADNITGSTGNDTFVIATRADTRNGFAATDTTTANIDKITDFVGNGAAAGDTIRLGIAAATDFGGALAFTGATVANVTAVTVATAADFAALVTAVQAASAGVASAAATAQVYDVTVTAGNLAGRYAIVNDDTAGIAATDTIIAITGATGALNAQDFTFA